MPARVRSADDALDAVRPLLRERGPRAGGTTVVGVDGRSGAGKSAFADLLAAGLGGVPVVRLDDVYPGWDGLEAGVRRVLTDVLQPWAAGREGLLRRHDWVSGGDGPISPLPASPLVVLEGVGAGARALAPYLSALVWVEAPDEDRYRRAMERDGEGYRPHWTRWAEQERRHLAREGTRQRADVELDTSTLSPAAG